MSASNITALVSTPLCLASSKHQAEQPCLLETIQHQDIESSRTTHGTSCDPFLFTHLPYELRQLIFTQYFASLPTQNITCSNNHLPHHSLTPLALSSPFLEYDPSPNLYYRRSTFSFSCPETLKAFSKSLSPERRNSVKKLKVVYGRCDQPSRDWVYLLASNFPSVEEVTFSIYTEQRGSAVEHPCFGNWWGCVRDAVREGLAGSKEVHLKLEDGDEIL